MATAKEDQNIVGAENEPLQSSAASESAPKESMMARLKASKGSTVFTAEEARQLSREMAAEQAKKDEIKKKSEIYMLNFVRSFPYQMLWKLLVAVLYSLPIAAIIISVLYLKKEYCPADHIALVMLITGIIVLLLDIHQVFLPLIRRRMRRNTAANTTANGTTNANTLQIESEQTAQQNMSKSKACFLCIFGVLKFFGSIYACIIVFRLAGNVEYEDKESAYFCNKNLFLVSFWILVIPFIIFGLFFLMSMIAGLYGYCKSRREGRRELANQV